MLVVLGKIGYAPFKVDGVRLLYLVISDSCGRRNVVLMANTETSKRGMVLADDKLAAVIVGRVVHYSRFVEFDNPGHRREESLMLGKSRIYWLARAEIRNSFVAKLKKAHAYSRKISLTKHSRRWVNRVLGLLAGVPLAAYVARLHGVGIFTGDMAGGIAGSIRMYSRW